LARRWFAASADTDAVSEEVTACDTDTDDDEDAGDLSMAGRCSGKRDGLWDILIDDTVGRTDRSGTAIRVCRPLADISNEL